MHKRGLLSMFSRLLPKEYQWVCPLRHLPVLEPVQLILLHRVHRGIVPAVLPQFLPPLSQRQSALRHFPGLLPQPQLLQLSGMHRRPVSQLLVRVLPQNPQLFHILRHHPLRYQIAPPALRVVPLPGMSDVPNWLLLQECQWAEHLRDSAVWDQIQF